MQAQRLTRLSIEGRTRTLSALYLELERTRSAYDSAIENEWTIARSELSRTCARLAAQVKVAEERLVDEHDRTIGSFNEALVVIQQAGMAAARLVAHKSDPEARQGF